MKVRIQKTGVRIKRMTAKRVGKTKRVQGSRIRGFKDSSEMLRNFKNLKVWQKTQNLTFLICLDKDAKFTLTRRRRGRREL